MYSLEVKEEVDKIFDKLYKKDAKLFFAINKKIKSIRENPSHVYKFLRRPLQMFNRVHIGNQFVLIFKIDHNRKMVVIYYFNHRDKVYNWKE